MSLVNQIHDTRTDCYSVMTEMKVGDYLKVVEKAHADRGGIEGQRAVLGTTTARRIRDRMVSDITQGAVLPPIVIGLVVDVETFNAGPLSTFEELQTILAGAPGEDVAIIDGMQRTAALLAASEQDESVSDRPMRVEFWLTRGVRALIYRMLVLNTGQVPWTLDRQIAVVFASMLGEVRDRVPSIEKLITPDEPGRRVGAAQLRFDSIVEMYMAFSLRKATVDTKEQVSDEFSRLDFVENLDDTNFQAQFYGVLEMLVDLDKEFSRAAASPGVPLSSGRRVFDRQPARIGFSVAFGLKIIGRPGESRSSEKKARALQTLQSQHQDFLDQLKRLNDQELVDFLRLDVLGEVLDKRVGQVGRYERGVFQEAFKVLIEEQFDVTSMEICWRAA
ncbi:hypothetical protein [Gordonia terrae]|uniref:DUF262 domain-containing protein n=1 Tax=Gordonia terrae NBRC 100016 TaxID=1089454 RepID=A0ABQ0HAG6_9ACTN|nr:hypothetical protein [Gordonia terrae]GAB42879.1 hypothetical protein GOTRE_026_01320 [Gordonia terrae NBRC 100016]VTR10128.1 Uncharacterised protein [Clostridioides difficile]VTS49440.1 Uncharacterised protein [Gordonia terrae]